MKVWFIGAGPGAPDLITLRGHRLIKACPVCLYAGSLVPPELVAEAPEGARVINTAPLNLDEIMAEVVAASERGEDVARVHSGDPSIYGAIGEQMRRLNVLQIAFEIVPGVPAFAAAAARIGAELTLPEISQTIILTRTPGKASKMPPCETLANLGASGATLAIHLSIRNLGHVATELTPHYGAGCPVVIAYRATWPDERYFFTSLAEMRALVRAEKITRTALVLVGPVFDAKNFPESALYSPAFRHILRNQGKKKNRFLGSGN
jgi:precorrin-4/cobalt-precorrin-4 C11-methyltransferase